MYRVIIAEDEKDSLEGMLNCVKWKESGFTIVATATDGNTALSEILDKKPHIALIDIQMPGISGLQVIEKAKDTPGIDTVFIILSGYDYFSYAQRAIRLGVEDYLIKPFRPIDLLNSCKSVIKNLKTVTELSTNSISDYFSFYTEHCMLNDPEKQLSGFVYPIEEEAQIINHICSAKVDKCIKSIHDFFCRLNPENICLSNNYFLSLYLSIQRLLSQHNIFSDGTYFTQYDWNRNNYFDNLQSVLVGIVKEACVKIPSVKKVNTIAIRAARYIDEYYSDDITLELVAIKAFSSPAYLSTVFKQSFGIGFTDYLNMLRINKAKKLLAETTLKIYEVAECIGYKDVKYFSQSFRRYTGLTPSQYRIDSNML